MRVSGPSREFAEKRLQHGTAAAEVTRDRNQKAESAEKEDRKKFWVHEIEHDGFRLMERPAAPSTRCGSRNGCRIASELSAFGLSARWLRRVAGPSLSRMCPPNCWSATPAELGPEWRNRISGTDLLARGGHSPAQRRWDGEPNSGHYFVAACAQPLPTMTRLAPARSSRR